MNAAAALSCFIYMETKVTLNKLEHTQHILPKQFCTQLKSLLSLRSTGYYINCGIY